MVRLALIALLALVIVGCGEQGPRPTAPLNGSDQSFIREMIPHHRGAIAMSRVAIVKSDDKRIKTLAQSIIDGQEREVTEMRNYRLAPLPADQTDHHHTDETEPLLKSKNFDHDFLRAMIVHHRAAIPMSQVVTKDGQNRQVKLLAAKIIKQQNREIAQMSLWLRQIESSQINEPVIDEKTKGKPSATQKSDQVRPLTGFNLGSLELNSKNPEALMTTTVEEASEGRYGVEVINSGNKSYDIVVALASSGRERLIEEVIRPGQSKLMSAAFRFQGKSKRDFTIKAKIKNR